ncbi:PrsW family intramembrane metalloprotease [Panacibacter sp. KCS-6]|uniref:PrsW family intramembrane metalloprotease n=2 Tax=Limnovirga soli TaxID=2656915 RepID=A0A8J8FB86_9BACT|nr:PrsW family intramembrane metalloprotease [Limnovirga soli]
MAALTANKNCSTKKIFLQNFSLLYFNCMELLLLAIAPGFAISLYIYAKDKHNREPAKYLISCFIFGVLSAIPAIVIEMIGTRLSETYLQGILPVALYIIFQAFIVVACTEEYCKYFVLKKYAYPKPAFDEPFDGIVYSVMVSMGFATIENIGYVFDNGFSTGIVRMLVSVPAHAAFAVMMGYYAGLAKFNAVRKSQLLLKGFLLAVLFHGLFDGFLFLSDNDTITAEISGGLLVFGGLASYYFAIRLSLKSIKLHSQLSAQMHKG